jgi:uncharacterized protein YcbK (DUF882 family)
MEQLTKNFRSAEFDCKDGTQVPLDLHGNRNVLADQLQVIRDYFGRPVYINSAYRSVQHNKNVGGASRSFHLLCMASDIQVKGLTPRQVFDGVKYLILSGEIRAGGLKQYGTFVHYDFRGVLTLF